MTADEIRGTYVVEVFSSDESCDESYLKERFNSLRQATNRFDEIATEGGWGDGRIVGLFQSFGDWMVSVDLRML